MATWKKQRRIDLNPSSADRWTTCTASPKYIYDNWDKLPEQDRTFADEGTTAHEVAAAMLQNRPVNPKDCPVPVKPEMNWHAWEYMEFVEGLREEGGRILVEQKLPLFYAEGRNAIVDAAIINPNSLHIVDYKYGEGIIVDPTNNLQATIYAKSVVWAVLNSRNDPKGVDDFPISITIYQPRTRNTEDAPYHTWHTTWGVIAEKAKFISMVADSIREWWSTDIKIVFAPSAKACQWCPAKGFCEARPIGLMKEVSDLSLTEEQRLSAILTHGDQIKKWLTDREAYALQLMSRGTAIPGHKLALSRGGNRYWRDPQLAGKLLLKETILTRDEVYEEKVIGPAAVEKLLGKGRFPKDVFNLIAKAPGQPIIVPEDDPRTSMLIYGTKEFADLDA